jgi:hypothetical protein
LRLAKPTVARWRRRFVADRVSTFTFVEFNPRTTMLTGAAFLCSAIAAFPSRIHTVLSDNGRPFADVPHHDQPAPHSSPGPNS